MSKTELSKRVKELRNRKGLSQEQLAENSGLSLRTIQRIENGETEPRGETLKRLMHALEAAPDDLMDWNIVEDKGFLTAMNLSALGFLFFPLLGILIPLILWISKKDKVKNVNEIGKAILNFQITWVLFFFVFYIILFGVMILNIDFSEIVALKQINPFFPISVIFILYSYNLVMIVVNSVLIYNNKKLRYFPKFVFIR